MTDVTAIQGSGAVLDCIATGDPQPTVTWSLNSIQLPNQDSTRIQQTSNNSLVISPVQTTDRGEYVCRAVNSAGSDSTLTQLIVYGKECVCVI